MAGKSEKAQVVLEFDGKNVKVLDQANKKLKKVDSTAKKTGVSIKAGFIAATAAVVGLAVVLKKSLDAFGVQEQAVASLNQSLKNTGNFSKAASQDLQNYAAELQKVTVFGDEATIQGMSLIASFGIEGQALKDLTRATQDLAAAKGMDLKAASDLVAKSVGSSTNALMRYGVQIEGAVGSTERTASAVKNITALFGGQAKAQADTYAGAITQMKNAFGDVMEVLGEQFAPLVGSVARWATKNMSAIQEAIRKVGVQVRTVMWLFGNWAAVLGTFAQVWGTTWTFIKEKFSDFWNLFKQAGQTLVLFMTGQWKEALVSFKETLTDHLANAQDDWASYKDAVAANIDTIKAKWKEETQVVKAEAFNQTQTVRNATNTQTQHWSNAFRKQAGMKDLSAKQQMSADTAIGQAATNLSSLMQSKNKDAFKVGKAAAIGTAIIQTYQAAQAAFASLAAIPVVGPILGAAAAGAAIVAGLARVASIRSTQMPAAQYGGLVPGTSKGTPVVVGENYRPEAITPLSPGIRGELGLGGGGGTHLHLHIHDSLITNDKLPQRFLRQVDDGLEYLRRKQNSAFAYGVAGI